MPEPSDSPPERIPAPVVVHENSADPCRLGGRILQTTPLSQTKTNGEIWTR